jgi:hypothetical protein
MTLLCFACSVYPSRNPWIGASFFPFFIFIFLFFVFFFLFFFYLFISFFLHFIEYIQCYIRITVLDNTTSIYIILLKVVHQEHAYYQWISKGNGKLQNPPSQSQLPTASHRS